MTTAVTTAVTTAELVRLVEGIPTPVDPDFGPCRAYVETRDSAWRVAFARDGGRVMEPAGPAFPPDRAGGRAARALCGQLNIRLTPAPWSASRSDSAGASRGDRSPTPSSALLGVAPADRRLRVPLSPGAADRTTPPRT